MSQESPRRFAQAERVSYIVSRLRTRADITPAELAAELHVSERTVYRDISHLEQSAAIKKRYSRSEGRYIFEAELTLPPLCLTPSEAIGLFNAASRATRMYSGRPDDALRSGLRKIRQLLTSEADPKPSTGGRASWAVLPSDVLHQPLIDTIRGAMRSSRKLSIRYCPAADNEISAIVSPYDLRVARQRWCLLGRVQPSNRVRIFALNRIRDAEILSDRFRLPRRSSPDALFARALETSEAAAEDMLVNIRFSPEVARQVAENIPYPYDSMTFQADGGLLCSVIVSSYPDLARWVLSFGSDVEVVGPPEMRASFRGMAQRIADLYSSPVSSLGSEPYGSGKRQDAKRRL